MTHRGRRGKKRSAARELLSLVLFCVLFLAARSSLADHYRIPSGSMLPTVEVGDHVVVNKAAYSLRIPFTDVELADTGSPRRGDVVVAESPEEDKLLLKRVVALAGDVVTIEAGQIALGGEEVILEARPGGEWERLGRGHLVWRTHGGGPSFGPVRIPANHLLLVGDNRGDSHDGRSFGVIHESAVRGRAFAAYQLGDWKWNDL